MAHYLVTAKPRAARLDELRSALQAKAFADMKPFGKAMTHALENARLRDDGLATWEEEDYCSPPLEQERDAALDHYFQDIRVEPVAQGDGWKSIDQLPRLFPDL